MRSTAEEEQKGFPERLREASCLNCRKYNTFNERKGVVSIAPWGGGGGPPPPTPPGLCVPGGAGPRGGGGGVTCSKSSRQLCPRERT